MSQMDKATHYFTVAVIVADIFAVVYFGGNYILNGSIMGAHETHAENMVATADHGDGGHEGAAEVAAVDPNALPEDFVASAEKGASIAGKCKACHSFDAGGPNRVGPALWGIYGADIMHHPEFGYSSAFQGMTGQIVWNEETLNEYLTSPRKYIPGNKMAFAGLKKAEDRANLIEYLKTLK